MELTNIDGKQYEYSNKTPIMLIIILVLQNMSIFFSDIINAITVIQLLCMVLYFFYILLNGRSLKWYSCMACWGIYCMVAFFNAFIGGEISFAIFFVACNLNMVFMSSIRDIGILEYKIVKLCCWVHLIASLAVTFLPQSLIDTVFRMLLGGHFSSNYSWRVISGVNPGITTQPGTNAMFLSLLLIIYAIEIFVSDKNRIIKFCLCAVIFIMIFTTAKRSAIIISLISILISWLLLRNKTNKILSANRVLINSFILVAVILAFRYVYVSTDLMDSLMTKMFSLADEGNVFNGRLSLWSYSMDVFWSNPIFGSGLKSIYNLTGYDTHNTYIQILAETGIVGFIFFISGIFLVLKNTLYRIKDIFSGITDIECKNSLMAGCTLMIFLLIYGTVGNTFIDYLPVMLFCLSYVMANSEYGVEQIGE
ncbi:MAG: O-antigen ligase family protein [Clostridiales bacterium]|nr:O-antigen ligase family protein [Clostridiales bacterium]